MAFTSWRMDETYIKVKGQWVYLYRAVDKEGNTLDFMLSEKRDEPEAQAFFEKAIASSGIPDKVTMDKNGANKDIQHNIKMFIEEINKDVFRPFLKVHKEI